MQQVKSAGHSRRLAWEGRIASEAAEPASEPRTFASRKAFAGHPDYGEDPVGAQAEAVAAAAGAVADGHSADAAAGSCTRALSLASRAVCCVPATGQSETSGPTGCDCCSVKKGRPVAKEAVDRESFGAPIVRRGNTFVVDSDTETVGQGTFDVASEERRDAEGHFGKGAGPLDHACCQWAENVNSSCHSTDGSCELNWEI